MNTSEKRLKISHNNSGEGKNVSKTFKDTRKRKQNIWKEQNNVQRYS